MCCMYLALQNITHTDQVTSQIRLPLNNMYLALQNITHIDQVTSQIRLPLCYLYLASENITHKDLFFQIITDVNDKNNNQLDVNTISMVSDNFLETIHEDTELMINHREDNQSTHRDTTPTPKETVTI